MKIMDYKIGDEVWWFQCRNTGHSYTPKIHFLPGTVELVHDIITDIEHKSNVCDEPLLICWHNTHKPSEIWGKTRQEAWTKLKKEIEKWGELE